jgi:hypothetical protein
METERKLFRVMKLTVYERGCSNTVEWVKYFECASKETVRIIVQERYGAARYYRYDECETQYEIEEIKYEIL